MDQIKVIGRGGSDEIDIDDDFTLDTTLLGGDGDDSLSGGSGADDLVGGDGIDIADYLDRTANLTITMDSGTDNDGASGEGDNVSGMNVVWGGSGNDSITGDSTSETLNGNGGNDTIDGGSGNDTLDGGANNDELISGAGNDRMDGGTGTDTIDFRNAGSGISITLDNTANDSVDGYTDNILDSVDSIIGSDFTAIRSPAAAVMTRSSQSMGMIRSTAATGTIQSWADRDTIRSAAAGAMTRCSAAAETTISSAMKTPMRWTRSAANQERTSWRHLIRSMTGSNKQGAG